MSNFTVVVTAIVKFENKFLILKRSPTMKIHPNLWSFPGGKLEPGEDIFECLKREIKEETNLEVKPEFRYISNYTYQRKDKTWTLGLCFLTESKSDKVQISTEFTDFKWITKEEFNKYEHIDNLDNEIKNI